MRPPTKTDVNYFMQTFIFDRKNLSHNNRRMYRNFQI